MKYDPFIYGKDQTERITSIEIEDRKDKSCAVIYRIDATPCVIQNEYYILYSFKYKDNLIRLAGNLHYKYADKFNNNKDYQKAIAIAKQQGWDYFTVYNPKESFMIKNGFTYYKGMEPKDLSILSFDIETTGLSSKVDKVLMISVTHRNCNGIIFKRLFTIDEYNSEKEMIYAFCNYVIDRDPDVITGHNIFGFDLPFLKARLGKDLPIGKLSKDAKVASRPSQFRKDGSQSYEYNNVLVYGREVVDTFHLSIKYDTARNYPSYKLKEIIKSEGLERPDRQHFDASTIGQVYKRYIDGDDDAIAEWNKIKKYAIHDADDALALFDLMIPAYFYYTQHIPKTLQQVVNSASGSQINSFMIRSYLMEKHSLPKSSDLKKYEGGISFGNPGIYRNVAKVDVASLYPSIILDSKIYDSVKDPKANFLKMVKYFTKQRLDNKRKYKETQDRKYKDLSEAQKIIINSAYGFMGAHGLLFNSPDSAALVTMKGRDILNQGINWAEAKKFKIVNADTDSFSFTTEYESKITESDLNIELRHLNSFFSDTIKWENDGIYDSVLVVKAKNYVLRDAYNGKVSIKGSALKATMKEPALINFNKQVIGSLLDGRKEDVKTIYGNYVRDIYNINGVSISSWASRKTITKSVLRPERTNEQRIKDAIEEAGKVVQEGDKISVFFETDTKLSLVESFSGKYSKKKLLGKLFNTVKVFDSVIDLAYCPNLTLKKNQFVLDNLGVKR